MIQVKNKILIVIFFHHIKLLKFTENHLEVIFLQKPIKISRWME